MHNSSDRTTAKPDLAASREAALTPAPQLVAKVRETLGSRLTALIAGVKDARTIDSWTRPNAKAPDLLVGRRLQIAFAATIALRKRYDTNAIASWFTWLAEDLDDRSPASILAKTTEDDVDEKGREILKAARSHLAE